MGEKLVLLRSIILYQSSSYEEVEVDGITHLQRIHNGVKPRLEVSELLNSELGVKQQLTTLRKESLLLEVLLAGVNSH